LDNCEHVIDAAASLVDTLLGACQGLRVLATSRQPLGLEGEVAWRVTSLSVPEDGSADIAEVLACEAAQLFADRAGRSRPGFQVTERNAAAVSEICRRLDGIPLAIELAAARVRVFTPTQIAAGLSERFRLLTGGARTTLARQQTLEASVDWSHHLLTDLEQVVFRRLAVFAGSFSFEAAQEVCAHGTIEPYQVLDLLTLLIDKSLVLVDDDGEVARYAMLETVRYYAAQRLAAAGEDHDTRTFHRDYYLAFAEEAEPHLEGPGQTEWIERIALEYTNVRTGLSWSQNQEHGELLIRTAAALLIYWFAHGPIRDGEQWLDAAAAYRGQVRPDWAAKALYARSFLALMSFDTGTAEALAEEGLGLARELSVDRLTARLRLLIGIAEVLSGQPTGLLEEAIIMARRLDDQMGLSYGLAALGFAKAMQDPSTARPYLEESVAVAEETGNRAMADNSRAHLAAVLWWLGDLAAADNLCQLVVDQTTAAGDQTNTGTALLYQSCINLERGRLVEARRAADRMERVTAEAGLRLFDTFVATLHSQLSLSEGDTAGALRHGKEAMATASIAQTAFYALPALIEAELAAELHENASADVDQLLHMAETASYAYQKTCGLILKARVNRLRGDLDQAERLGHEGLKAAHAMSAKCRIVDAIEVLAGVTADQLSPVEAGRLFGAAQAIRDIAGYMGSVSKRATDSAALRDLLGDAGFDKVFNEGRAFGLQEAVAYAQRSRGERTDRATS
jgi:predicted ATPase